MGVKAPRIEANRVRLAEKIPMDTPMSVTIVPTTFCTFACTFCPDRLIKNKSTMKLAEFERIIDRSGFPNMVNMLHLYNVGEPLINANLPDMIAYAKGQEFSRKISLVTNAFLLDRWATHEILASGLDRMIISIYGLSNDSYLNNTNTRVVFEYIYENVKYFYKVNDGRCKVYIKVIDRAVPNPEAYEFFVHRFAPLCDFYSVEPILPIWPMFKQEGEITDKGLYEGIPAAERIACHYPFYSMVVNPDGKVHPCLGDWAGAVTLGDANVDSLNKIWNSEAYREFRMLQLNGQRKTSCLCSTCGTLAAATALEDVIDDDIGAIKGRM